MLQNFNFKKSGYFIEFGATNGIDHSNSYLLETRFNWGGIIRTCSHLALVTNS